MDTDGNLLLCVTVSIAAVSGKASGGHVEAEGREEHFAEESNGLIEIFGSPLDMPAMDIDAMNVGLFRFIQTAFAGDYVGYGLNQFLCFRPCPAFVDSFVQVILV